MRVTVRVRVREGKEKGIQNTKEQTSNQGDDEAEIEQTERGN